MRREIGKNTKASKGRPLTKENKLVGDILRYIGKSLDKFPRADSGLHLFNYRKELSSLMIPFTTTGRDGS